MNSDIPEKHLTKKNTIIFDIENILDSIDIEIDYLEELPQSNFKFKKEINYNTSICKYFEDLKRLKQQLELCKFQLTMK